MRPNMDAAVWAQITRSVIAKYVQGLNEQAFFAAIERCSKGACEPQECPFCRASADLHCTLNHTTPRGDEVLC